MNKIILEENKLILPEEIITLLSAKQGDRIQVEYTNKDGEVIPVLIKSEAGNKLTKSNTVSFRGKNNEMLSSYGIEFDTRVEDGIIYLIGSNPKTKVFTDVQKAVEHVNKEIIENKQFNIKTNFEL